MTNNTVSKPAGDLFEVWKTSQDNNEVYLTADPGCRAAMWRAFLSGWMQARDRYSPPPAPEPSLPIVYRIPADQERPNRELLQEADLAVHQQHNGEWQVIKDRLHGRLNLHGRRMGEADLRIIEQTPMRP